MTIKRLSISDGLHPEDLVQAALHHYQAGVKLYGLSPLYFDSGGYLIHMSAELILKAWIQEVTGSFPMTHFLEDLYKELIDIALASKLSSEQNMAIALLDTYEKLRYPNRKNPVEVGDSDLISITSLHQYFLDNLPGSLIDKIGAINDLSQGGRVIMKKPIEK